MAECPVGYFGADDGLCRVCNSPCMTCFDNKIKSCSSCKPIVDTTDETSVTYKERFLFNNMCMGECPFSTSPKLSIANASHICTKIDGAYGEAPEIEILLPGYEHQISMRKTIRMRAVMYDSFETYSSLLWSVLDEDLISTNGLGIFKYEDLLGKSTATLNISAFNYVGVRESIKLQVLVVTSNEEDKNFDVTEVFPNRPPDITSDKTSFDTFPTALTPITVSITDVQDTDERESTLKIKAYFRKRYTGSATALAASSDAILVANMLTEDAFTLTGLKIYKKAQTNLEFTVTLPLLLNGVTNLKGGGTTSTLSGDLYISVEDQFKGITKAYRMVEIYHDYTKDKKLEVLTTFNSYSFEDWDKVLLVAHSMETINDEFLQSPFSLKFCSLDSHCGSPSKGYCHMVHSMGYCECRDPYIGQNCQWTESELTLTEEITDKIMGFLKTNYIDAENVEIDFNIMEMIATTLKGILKNPEAISSSHMDTVMSLVDILGEFDGLMGIRIENYDKDVMMVCFSRIMEYIVTHQKTQYYQKDFLLSTGKNDWEDFIETEEIKYQLSQRILKVRNVLYNFLNKISNGQYPSEKGYYKTTKVFDALVTSEYLSTLFPDSTSESDRIIKIPSSNGFVKLHPDLFTDLKSRIEGDNKEFKIRIVKWIENPYIFANTTSQVETSVFNVMILDGEGEPIEIESDYPIRVFLPRSQYRKQFKHGLKCYLFNENRQVELYSKKYGEVNLEGTDLSDDAIKFFYPEIDPIINKQIPNIEQTYYQQQTVTFPDFDEEGITGIGSYDILTDTMIECAMFEGGEIAALYPIQYSDLVPSLNTAFYNDFVAMRYWSSSLGFYVIMFFLSVYCGLFGLGYIMDKCTLGDRIKNIEIRIQQQKDKYQKDKVFHPSGSVYAKQMKSLSKKPIEFTKKSHKRQSAKGGDTFIDIEKAKVRSKSTTPSKIKSARTMVPKSKKTEKYVQEESSHRQRSRSNTDRDVLQRSKTPSESKKHKSTKIAEQKKFKEILSEKIKNEKKKLEINEEVVTSMDEIKPNEEDQEAEEIKNDENVKKTSTKVRIATLSKDKTDTLNVSQLSLIGDSELNLTHQFLKSHIPEEKKTVDTELPKKKKRKPKTFQSRYYKDMDHAIKKKVEEMTFSFWESILQGNQFINFFRISSITFPRSCRASSILIIMLYHLFWTAILVKSQKRPIEMPEEEQKVTKMVNDVAWIPFLVPILTGAVSFLYSGLFKISHNRIQRCHSIDKFKKILEDLKQEMLLRMFIGYIISATTAGCLIYYIIEFSSIYGWIVSSAWFWCFIISVLIDMLLYDVFLAFIQSTCYNFEKMRKYAKKVYYMRNLKQATMEI